MEHFYSVEKNTQMVLALLKAHGIKRIIASPGGTNVAFVASAQHDPYFEMYSCVDERSAAYMACGMAAESGEPVVLSCTGATASRNYMPGLTEAYYRKLPVLAVTSSRAEQQLGQLRPQITNRSIVPTDIFTEHVVAPFVIDNNTERLCRVAINKAILALTHNGGGPAHIDLHTLSSTDFSTKTLPDVCPIYRYSNTEQIPNLSQGGIVIFIGSHKAFSQEEVASIEHFCEQYNAVVLTDHTSNYYGKYSIQSSLILGQEGYYGGLKNPRLLIHIGEISGDYYSTSITPQEVWRVSEDGEIRDLFGTLTNVFEMSPQTFFEKFVNTSDTNNTSFYKECRKVYEDILKSIPELPFSNAWIAQQLSKKLPPKSIIHFGILNSLRCWNFFELPNDIRSNCNVGGFGIDGSLSSLIGASQIHPDRLYFAVLGDLGFFYDMNALGNRHVGNNVRILLINNGLGQEFKNPGYVSNYHFEELTDPYIAAKGHYACQSRDLVKHYAEDLGFEYINASDKDEFEQYYSKFVSEDIVQKPMILEVFTNTEDETLALEEILSIIPKREETLSTGKRIKKAIKEIVPKEKITALKTLLS